VRRVRFSGTPYGKRLNAEQPVPVFSGANGRSGAVAVVMWRRQGNEVQRRSRRSSNDGVLICANATEGVGELNGGPLVAEETSGYRGTLHSRERGADP
jgi:hypothetical protein